MTTYDYDLGTYSRNVSTDSASAQQWFDRGLNWTFGYHHEEALVCFNKALEHDPDLAMLTGRSPMHSVPTTTTRGSISMRTK